MQGQKSVPTGACCGTFKLCSHVCGEGMTWFVLLVLVLSTAVSAPVPASVRQPGAFVRGVRAACGTGRHSRPRTAPLPALSQRRLPAPQALGVLLVMRESLLVMLPDAHFTSHTAFGWALALGVLCVIVASYGLLTLTPCCLVSSPRGAAPSHCRDALTCVWFGPVLPRAHGSPAGLGHWLAPPPSPFPPQFDGVDHRKLFGIVAFVLAVVLLGAAAMNVSWALSEGELRAQLEFGWHEAFHGRMTAGLSKAAGKKIIREAQTDLHCCGFGTAAKDRSAPPCPRGAAQGCEAPLLEELRLALFVMAGMEGGGALLALLTVAMVACNAEASKYGLSRGEAPSGGAMASATAEVRPRARSSAPRPPTHEGPTTPAPPGPVAPRPAARTPPQTPPPPHLLRARASDPRRRCGR